MASVALGLLIAVGVLLVVGFGLIARVFWMFSVNSVDTSLS